METYQSGYRSRGMTHSIVARKATFEEVCALTPGQHIIVLGYHGWINVRVNGAVKRWKTRPSDCRVPIKYGLKECAYIEWEDGKCTSTCEMVIPSE